MACGAAPGAPSPKCSHSGRNSHPLETAVDNYLKALDVGALSTEYDGSITDITGRLKNEGFN